MFSLFLELARVIMGSCDICPAERWGPERFALPGRAELQSLTGACLEPPDVLHATPEPVALAESPTTPTDVEIGKVTARFLVCQQVLGYRMRDFETRIRVDRARSEAVVRAVVTEVDRPLELRRSSFDSLAKRTCTAP